MDREQMIERAIKFDFERNRRDGDFTSPFNPEDMADFAIDQIKADRQRIAADLQEILSSAPDPETFIVKIDLYSETLKN